MAYTLRYLPEGDEPFEVYTESTALEEGLDRYGTIDELTEDVPPGTYDTKSHLRTP